MCNFEHVWRESEKRATPVVLDGAEMVKALQIENEYRYRVIPQIFDEAVKDALKR